MVSAHGRLFYTKGESTRTGGGTSVGTHPVLYCLDQFTGEEIYRRDLPGSGSGGTPNIEMSQEYKYDPRVGTPVIPSYSIWLTSGGVWQVDPWTGNCLYYN